MGGIAGAVEQDDLRAGRAGLMLGLGDRVVDVAEPVDQVQRQGLRGEQDAAVARRPGGRGRSWRRDAAWTRRLEVVAIGVGHLLEHGPGLVVQGGGHGPHVDLGARLHRVGRRG